MKESGHEHCFKIINTNATSLNNKIMELQLYLQCSGWPHVVGIAENWFSDTSVPTIGGYALYRRDRGSLHGGVCIYVMNDVKNFEVLNVSEDDKGAEHIWCGIRRGDDKILVGCMY